MAQAGDWESAKRTSTDCVKGQDQLDQGPSFRSLIITRAVCDAQSRSSPKGFSKKRSVDNMVKGARRVKGLP